MRKNLLIAVVGPTSLHRHWMAANREYDVMIVYYGDQVNYKGDGEYFLKEKGTKFNIIGKIADSVPSEYEHIFIPDDDLYLSTDDINRFFKIAAEYKLALCQPAIIGYYSIPLTLPVPSSILRYTNYVEIMCPCFSQQAFHICKSTFNYNRSCWGIELIWDQKLGHPEDQIGIVDDVLAVHTRPCFKGDNYVNNMIERPLDDVLALKEDLGLSWDKKTYSVVEQTELCKDHFYPPVDVIKPVIRQLLSTKKFI